MGSRNETGERILKIAMAGGGTGGHVFPGVAILKALKKRAPVEVLWIGTGRDVEKKALNGVDCLYKMLRVRPFYGTNPARLIRSILGLPISILKARAMLKAFDPHCIIGIGGYVAGPTVIAGRILKIPVFLHEQNVVPGLTNRLGARFAHKVFISFKGASKWFPKKKTCLTGNPVRDEFKDLDELNQGPDPDINSRKRPKKILVLGGSQGARAINRLATSAIAILSKSGMELEVLHQTGDRDLDNTKRIYMEMGIKARVKPFINDMANAYTWADLAIARAGAGTCAELAVTATPAILIPYPHAASNHQKANAKELESSGASITFQEGEVGPERLASAIQMILSDKKRLIEMSKAAKAISRPDAADCIAGEILNFLRENEP